MYYAHSNDLDISHWQLLIDHLENTANLAKKFGTVYGLSDLAYLAARLHDIGKYSDAFQARLRGDGPKIDHSTAGAQAVIELFQNHPRKKVIATLLAYCIAGHHGGLPDYGSPIDLETDATLHARLKKSIEEFHHYINELDPSSLNLPDSLPIKPNPQAPGFSIAFMTRMLFSTLVDADFQETESFIRGDQGRGIYPDMPALFSTYNQFLSQFHNPTSALNQKRTETLNLCLSKANDQPGIFTLTVPTGGGKTFASMAFALRHAVRNGMQRIIYVIPYTSIIEQNAAEFKRCLGEANVLEHHSNFDWDAQSLKERAAINDDSTLRATNKLKLAAENWDIPIVVTTNVQFFESLFASRTSRCRKIHNLANSVIIFDEAQMLPREFLQPCMFATAELVRNYASTAIFCTATQPIIDRFLPPDLPIKEIIPEPKALFDFYRRVQVKSIGALSTALVIDRLNDHAQVLCVVNTRKHAREIFTGLGEGRFHLSTLMCPAHRKITIQKIRENLRAGTPCRVISTQIMEAGIDLDFPVGFRALAGLDSIIQVAGRVNREGKHGEGWLYVFEPEKAVWHRTPKFIQQSAEVSRGILRKYSQDPVCLPAIQEYFEQLYALKNETDFDTQGILRCFDKHTNQPDFDFRTAADKFHLIADDTLPVIIPFDSNTARLLQQLKTTEFPASFQRRLQPYTVNVYEREFETLQRNGWIDLYGENFAVLNNSNLYDAETGLNLPEEDRQRP